MPKYLESGQLPLPVRLDDSATLENFYTQTGSPNRVLVQSLQNTETQSLYIWGREGSGVTHLLQGLCHQAQSRSQMALYLPLSELKEESPEDVLNGLENTDLVCLDELGAVAASPDWAEQLFHLFNRILLSRGVIAFGAKAPPAQLETPLADLQSRLSSLLVHQVERLSDEDMKQALIFRAQRRGMDMPQAVADYLVTRHSRKLEDQFRALDTLDRATLTAQRKLTVPFVKSALEAHSHE